MRRFHRWFGLVVAVFMIIISVTGVILQVQVITEDHKGPPPGLVAGQPQKEPASQDIGESAPTGLGERNHEGPGHDGPAEKGGGDLHGLVMHIHSGEYFGKFANVIGLVCGVALLFFSVSGLWMYWQMFKARAKAGRNEVFWR